MSQMLQANFERCCRLCAEEQDVTIMIFSQEAEAMLLQNKLNQYLLIEIEEDDKLPKNICIQCCTKLQSVCDFIDKARKAQDVLLNRSLMLEQIVPSTCVISLVKTEAPEPEVESDNEKYTEMEVSVDPMVVLQNSEVTLSPCYEQNSTTDTEDVTYLHGLDTENVTIKLIRKGDSPKDSDQEENTEPVLNNLQDNEDSEDGPLQNHLYEKPFGCVECKRKFCTDLALKSHMWTHSTENKIENPYKCNTCLQTFQYKFDLIGHLKTHRSNESCQLCGRMFRSERTYIAHLSVHLPSNKAFTCKICGRSYNTWGSLKTHSVSHSSDRPYQCQYCKKNFKRKQDLKFHINQHTGAKPYKCPFCEKSFASSGNCYSHRNRMHPGKQPTGPIKKWTPPPKTNVIQLRPIAPKPVITTVNGIFKYQCHLCDHSFMKKDNYTYHMFQHTGEKPFSCSYCNERFMTRRGLLLHHDNKHANKDRPLALISKNILLK